MTKNKDPNELNKNAPQKSAAASPAASNVFTDTKAAAQASEPTGALKPSTASAALPAKTGSATNDNKISTKELAGQFLLGDILKAALKRFKVAAVPFLKMSQADQEAMLKDIDKDVREAVRNAVELIATDARVTFRAACEQVAFKPDGVKASLSMPNNMQAHALADAAGATVLVVIEDAKRYLHAGDALKGLPNQPPLFDTAAK